MRGDEKKERKRKRETISFSKNPERVVSQNLPSPDDKGGGETSGNYRKSFFENLCVSSPGLESVK